MERLARTCRQVSAWPHLRIYLHTTGKHVKLRQRAYADVLKASIATTEAEDHTERKAVIFTSDRGTYIVPGGVQLRGRQDIPVHTTKVSTTASTYHGWQSTTPEFLLRHTTKELLDCQGRRADRRWDNLDRGLDTRMNRMGCKRP